MVNLYVLNPAHKLRVFISATFFRGSKRILGTFTRHSTPQPALSTKRGKTSMNVDVVTTTALVRDADYYRDESEAGFCIFRVEDTLFKVHKFILSREPSAFRDMFSLPKSKSNHIDGSCDATSVLLSDTAEQFRDLLWALYASPSDLCICPNSLDAPTIDRLLNVAELTNKYCFASSESWAIERIYSIAQDPKDPIRFAPPATYARILEISILCNHPNLHLLIMRQLISRVLWQRARSNEIILIAEKYGLRNLQGVCYYRQLIDLKETPSHEDAGTTYPAFPPTINVERRRRFLAAHHSLVSFWEDLRATPTPVPSSCASHEQCIASWRDMWLEAALSSDLSRLGSADVLGRLKVVMIDLRKRVAEASLLMSLPCMLAAFEALTVARDEIINGLMDHFEES